MCPEQYSNIYEILQKNNIYFICMINFMYILTYNDTTSCQTVLIHLHNLAVK